MISANFNGSDKATLDRMQGAYERVTAGVAKQMDKEMISLRTYIVDNFLSGQVLNRGHGTLADSTQVVPSRIEGNQVIGGVTSAGGPAFYGVFFEKGGIKWYDIVPVVKKALAFFGSGGMVPLNASVVGSITRAMPRGSASAIAKFSQLGGITVKKVHHPPIPKLPYMGPGLDDKAPEIRVNVRKAAIRALRG